MIIFRQNVFLVISVDRAYVVEGIVFSLGKDIMLGGKSRANDIHEVDRKLFLPDVQRMVS